MTRKEQYLRAMRDLSGRISNLPSNQIYDLREWKPIIYHKMQDFFQFYYPDSSGNQTFSDFLNLLADDEVLVS